MTRKTRISILFILLLLSCGVPNKPKDVAEHFIKASLKMDSKEAKKYATPETAKMLDFVQNITSKARVNANPLKDIKIEMGEETIDGSHATVKYRTKGNKDDYYITLDKINGEWLVSAGMSDLNIDSDSQAGEKEVPADTVKANEE